MKLRQKGFAHLLLLIILLGGLVAGVYLATSKDPLKLFSKAASPKSQSVKTDQKPKGYIVQFKDPPVVANYISKGKGTAGGISAQSYEQSLKPKHEAAKKDIFQRLAPKAQDVSKIKILGEYTKSFNGLALDITEQQANRLRASPYVKQIYPNLSVKTNLTESVPLIGVDKVWQQKDNQGRAITGEGVKVGVIDTGVDYTHPDLGASQIPERDFQKIISDSGYHLAISSDSAKIAFDKTEIIDDQYHRRTTIYVYSSTGQKLNEFVVPDNEKFLAQLVVEGNYLAYFSWGDNGENAGVSMYNLTTGEHKRLENTNVVGTMHIYNRGYGEVLYFGTGQKNSTGWGIKYVTFKSYNLTNGSYFSADPPVVPTNAYTIDGAFDKTRVAFPVPEKDGDLCGKSLYVLNLFGTQGQSYNAPEVGSVVDFKDDEVLYIACNSANFDSTGSSYYLYNIQTSSATKLAYLPNTGQTAASEGITYKGLSTDTQFTSPQASTYNWNRYNAGLIGSNVVYFRRRFGSSKIIIYNKSQKNYYRLNIVQPIGLFNSKKDLICFVNSGVYCHNYDPASSYTIPNNVFNNKVVSGYNFVFPDEFPLDDHGHGTHVAAIVASNGNPKGIAPGAQIVTYKALNDYGSGYLSDIIAAIDLAAATRLDNDSSNDIDVLNMSLGANCYGVYNINCGPDDAVSQAADNAVDAGITVVVAAGNNGPNASTISTPGVARKVITVGAVDKSKTIAYSSSRGPVLWNNETINKPDIVAPGVNICAAEWSSWYYDKRCQDDKHIAISGTSMAAPHIAGVAALMKQVNPSLTPQQIKDIIKSKADSLPEYDQNTQGSGLVNASNLITSISPTPSPTPTPIPAPSQTFNFQAGWNFVGLTLDKGSGYKARDFINDLASESSPKASLTELIDQVDMYTGGGWDGHVTTPGFENMNNFVIKPGVGYMVKIKQPFSTTLSASASASLTSLRYGPGWNPISFVQVPQKINSSSKLLSEIRSQGGQISPVFTQVYRAKDGKWDSGTDFNIEPGEGYFIAFQNRGTFNLPAPDTQPIPLTKSYSALANLSLPSVFYPTPAPTSSYPSIKVSFKDTTGKPVSQLACEACWNQNGSYLKPGPVCQTGTEVVINKPGVCNTYNPVLGIRTGYREYKVDNVAANPTSGFKTFMNEYFGWSDIKTWTQGQRTLNITVKPAPRWTPAPRR